MSDELYHSNLQTPRASDATGTEPPASVNPPGSTNPQPPVSPTVAQSTKRPPGTRTSAAWIGICTVALLAVVLIIFMAQNTGSVQINFLWLHGSVPLALALLVAGVGSAILAMAIGTARIAQLRRRLSRQQR